MVDIKFIREQAEKIKEACKQKHISLDIDQLLALDKKRNDLQKQLEDLQRQRNENAASMKSSGGKPDQHSIEEGKRIKEEIAKTEEQFQKVDEAFKDLMVQVPTIPSPDTPIGKDESENKEILQKGKIPSFDFDPKDHITLGKELDLLDMERGTKVAGYRGYYVKNDGVLLMMGFLNYALQKMVAKGFTPMIPPTLVKGSVLFGSGYFKGKEYDESVDEIYMVASGDKEADGSMSKEKKFLVGTAEPSLLAYYANETLKEEDLPIKLVGISQCYRSEIGSYGKDTKGFYRVHEFMKVEQVILCKADIEESVRLQDEMVKNTTELYEDFNLPYRILQICTGDMSAGKYRMFDTESWSPSRNGWAEVASASNFLDWQSRRLNVKYVDKEGNKKYVYMLNNTVIPSPRPFLLMLENFQNKDGSVSIPKVLQPFMGGKTKITKKK
jgi:seryl-tRNA synthetase